MCGIAGAVDLIGKRTFPVEQILRMTGALAHRGPDDEQVHIEPGVALGVRRLSVIDIAGGKQPLCNETGDIWVAYEGELFEYPDIRQQLLGRGHSLKTNCDTEAWVHLYEDHGDQIFDYTHGQYGVSLWDRNQRTLLLGRDRMGIAPLFYTQADGWLLWASEIKGLLASGLVEAEPDLQGIDYFFNFFSLPNEKTCFKGINTIPPGNFLKIREGQVEKRKYWDLDFPDKGDELRFDSTDKAVEAYEAVLRPAVQRRLVGETPLCCYISGGLDSTTILGMSTQEREEPVPAFTASLDNSGPFDELPQARESAELLGSPLTTVRMNSRDITQTYPVLVQAAEGPVFDTSAACMIRLAQSVRQHGYTVSLTGEGADESLAGYVWFKIHKIDRATGRSFNTFLRNLLLSGLAGGGSEHRPLWAGTAGVRTAQQFTYEMMNQGCELLYSPSMWEAQNGQTAYDQLQINADRMPKWDPLNQSLYMANKVMLPGMLLAAKGDRPMRNGSTEGRFPFLDEHVVRFSSQLAPEYKLNRWTDKWLLRQLAKKVLPRQIASRPKTMFRAHWSKSFLGPDRPLWVDQLLSQDAIEKTGYFNHAQVTRAREMQLNKSRYSFQRTVFDMSLNGVIATQLWHHLFMKEELADLPKWSPPEEVSLSEKSQAIH